ncbi:cytochrome P450 [Dactylosporangium sp. NPDC051541]|uniref:cytochrome P450 n=1 Tax=Dactylosporangium sp. NPDC051541 TaxID=3363977 RepID=UPI0037874CB7
MTAPRQSIPATTSAEYTADVDPMDMLADPPAALARLRAQSPVVYVPAMRSWWVTGHAEVLDALSRPGEFGSRMLDHITYLSGRNVLVDDGEHHRRYRRAMAPTLKPAAIGRHTARIIAPVVAEAIAALRDRGAADLVADFWEPVAVRCFAGLLGANDLGEATLRRWYHSLALGAANFMHDEGTAEQARATSEEIDATLLPRMRELEEHPDNGLVAHLLAMAAGATLEERAADILPTIKILIGAGEQEPGHAGSSVLAGILTAPDVRSRLLNDPDDGLGDAIEEGLRWCPPVQAISRYTAVDTTLGGVSIAADQWVNLSLQGANHDPAVFGADAAHFRPDRDLTGRFAPLAFGGGLHMCAGASFGRAVIRAGLLGLLRELPDLALDPARPWSFTGFGFRAPGALWSTWRVV